MLDTNESLIISYSELSRWDSCHRQYYYRHHLGLKPEEEAVAMTTGTKGHKLLQSFYTALMEGLTSEQALVKTQERAKKLMADEKPGDFGLLKAWTLVDNFIRSGDFNADAVLVENRFLFPAASISDDPAVANVQIGFTPDVVLKRPGGFHDVEDAKFVQRAWSDKKKKRYVQTKIYQILLKRMGYNVSRTSIRFFNTTTAKIEVYPYTLKPKEEETIIHDFIDGIIEVLAYRRSTVDKKLTRRTVNNNTCQFCPFEFPCTLEAEGKDATKTLENMFVRSDYDYSK